MRVGTWQHDNGVRDREDRSSVPQGPVAHVESIASMQHGLEPLEDGKVRHIHRLQLAIGSRCRKGQEHRRTRGSRLSSETARDVDRRMRIPYIMTYF